MKNTSRPLSRLCSPSALIKYRATVGLMALVVWMIICTLPNAFHQLSPSNYLALDCSQERTVVVQYSRSHGFLIG
jgi:hypothetical protein